MGELRNVFFHLLPILVLLIDSGVRGGGKCPEEEHTTCSGGPTIYCHKRGLWGEKIFYKIFYFIK
jgi:hypothetical protein